MNQHLVPDLSQPDLSQPDLLLPDLPSAERLPSVLTSSDPESFAWGVLHNRHPALIEQARGAHPYQPAQHAALDRLLEEITTGTVQPLPDGAHDQRAWREWGAEFLGEAWDRAPFLWAESYFYRRLLHAVGFFSPGPWYWLDPFEHLKDAELRHPGLADELEALSEDEPAQRVLLSALWGNRADLGFTMGAASGETQARSDLVHDDSTALWSHLRRHRGTVCLVLDNAGRELLADLLLVDHLLRQDLAERVALHVKPTPYYVSDAVTADVAACLRRLAAVPGHPADAARRLLAAFRDGRVGIETHWFYCAPYEYRRTPPELLSRFAAASLTIMKGDLNYRRLVGDRRWDPHTSFTAATSYLPGPVAALRTLKSDVVVGLDADTVDRLGTAEPRWRTSGTHALLQLAT